MVGDIAVLMFAAVALKSEMKMMVQYIQPIEGKS
jgi:hypothetical protein